MGESLQKAFFGVIALGVSCIAIELIPVSRQAAYWNRCLKKTSASLSQVNAIKAIDDQSREVLSVMICNGAVFEPKFKPNIQ